MQKTRLLLDKKSLIVVNTELAVLIGLNEAIVLQQLHYWLEKNEDENRNFRDARYWTYNTVEEWQQKDFPFLSVRTIRRVLDRLEGLGLLVTLQPGGSDRTKHYSIDYRELNQLLDERRDASRSTGQVVNMSQHNGGRGSGDSERGTFHVSKVAT